MEYPGSEVIYRLVGEDVKMVLEDMGRQDIADDKKKLGEAVKYMRRKFEVPDWTEYMQIYLDLYLDTLDKEDIR